MSLISGRLPWQPLAADGFEIVDAKTFRLKLKEPTGQGLIQCPFMMPKRIAETDANTQISEFIGSGPFIFKTDEWRPGHLVVYAKFDKYKPRSEPALALAAVRSPKWIASNGAPLATTG